MKPKIKLVLVDDHSLFREGLCRLLSAEEDLELVANCSSIEEALVALQRNQVDLVLLDFDLGDQQGINFLERAKKQGYHGHVLMVTAGMSDADTLQALDRGAAGIFLKHSPPVELLKAIHKVVNGERWLDPSAARALTASVVSSQAKSHRPSALNVRERSVLKGVFEGLTNKEIAARLEISEGYVKAVLQQLFDKTGVRSRSQLVRIALEKYTEYGLDKDS